MPRGRTKKPDSEKMTPIRLSMAPDQMVMVKREAMVQRTSVSHILRQAVDLYLSKPTTSGDSAERRVA